MRPLVVADIGGTNARFGLISNASQQLEMIQTFDTGQFEDLQSCMSQYLEQVKSHEPELACLAVAAPVLADTITFTNLPWKFSVGELQSKFSFKHIAVINDFTAQACCLPKLDSTHLVNIKTGKQILNATKAVLGPGTGLGVAALLRSTDTWVPLSGEGGGCALAPGNSHEAEILKYLQAVHGYVSLETVLSGRGLVNLYTAVTAVSGEKAVCSKAEEITDLAVAGEKNCVNTLMLFCGWLGAVAGDMAMLTGALGGMYLAGGILPRITQFLESSQFCDRFTQKGLKSHYVKDIPVYLNSHPHAGLLGAAAYYGDCFPSSNQ